MRVRLVLLSLVLAAHAEAADWPLGFAWEPKAQVLEVARGERIESEGFTRARTTISEHVSSREAEQHHVNTECAWRFVRTVLAVKKGSPTSERVEMERWRCSDESGLPDESLAGRKIAIERGKVRVLGMPSSELTKPARRWIDEHLSPSRDPVLEAIEPATGVRSGATWVMDPIKLAMALRVYELSPIDPRSSEASARLVKTRLDGDVHAGKVEVKAKLELGRFPGSDDRWTEGGRLDAEVHLDGPLEPCFDLPLKLSRKGSLRGRATVVTAAGRTMRELEMQLEAESVLIRRAPEKPAPKKR